MNSPPVPSSFCLLVRRYRHDQLAPRLSASHTYRPSPPPCMRRHAHRKISGEHLAFRDYADLFWLSCARPVPLLSVGLLLAAVGCSFSVQSLLLRRGEDVAHVLNPAAAVLQILTCFRRCFGNYPDHS